MGDPATNTSGAKMSHRIVFTHSMGNLMLAGAIESGKCSIDKESGTTWYEVSGPMYGSKMATQLDKICHDGGLYKVVADRLGYCAGDSVSNAYTSLEPNYPGLDAVAKTIAPRLSGALCGTSAFGLYSMYSAELEATAQLAGFAQLNDGVVAWSSCSVKASVQFKPDYREPWYVAAINHIDSECYNGDGWFGDDRKPCAWYALRT